MASEMIRKNIRVTKEQNEFLKEWREKKGTSENTIIVMALEKYMIAELDRVERAERALRLYKENNKEY